MSSGCPVSHSGNKPSVSAATKTNIVEHSSPDSCPVKSSSDMKSPSGYNPLANDEIFGQDRQLDQKSLLSTRRTISTIPKGDFNPHHQISGLGKWVYPSEQQYYNAMRRKGYNPAENDIPVALRVHNLVNEEGWRKVKEWEQYRANSSPILKKFLGRPKDISPKARFLNLLGYELPFDRHDWVIERDGREVRYVIDFYRGKASPTSPISMYLDVRPACDSIGSIVDIASYHIRNQLAPWTLPVTSQSASSPFSPPQKDMPPKK